MTEAFGGEDVSPDAAASRRRSASPDAELAAPRPKKRRSDRSSAAPEDDDDADEEEYEAAPAVDLPAPLRRARENPRAAAPAAAASSGAAEAGIIKGVYVENFMCHRKLQVDFCPHVNFVNGENGSGKSAILAAIQICLGARASRTGRGRNLSALVRGSGPGGAGATKAVVRVSLANGGSDAYRPEVFGDVVTIERTIMASGITGGSGFRLLDQEGREKSRSKNDLVELLDHLNIQVDNPVSVLSQEEAKTFLNGDGKDKYDFFLRATELKRISAKHAAALDQVELLAHQTDKMRTGLKAEHETVKRLREKWEQHRQLDRLEVQYQQVVSKMGWAQYWDVEKRYQDAEEHKAAIERKAQKKMAELRRAEEMATQPGDEHAQLTDRITELIAEGQAASELKREQEDALRAAEQPRKQQARQLERLQKARAEKQRALAAAQKRLEAKRRQILEQANNSDEARFTAQLQEKEAALAQAQARTDAMNEDLNHFRRQYEELEPEVEQARSMAKNAESELYRVNQRLESLEKAGGEAEFAALGRNAEKVYRQVVKLQREGKFRGPVAGPVLKYLKIQPGKEKFGKLAELALGKRMLDKFVVTCDADRVLLNKIRQHAGCHQDCGVIQLHNDPRFNVPAPPAEGIETVASVLAVSDDLIFNALVDMSSIDQMALANDKKSSEDALLVRLPNGQEKMRGDIKEVYFYPRGDHWTIRGGGRSMISNEKDMTLTIGTDKSAAISNAKEEQHRISANVQNYKQDLARLENEHSKSQRSWSELRKKHKQNEKQIAELTSSIEAIRTELECLDNVVVDTKIEEEEVAEATSDIEQIRAEEAEVQEALEKLSPEIDEIRSRLAATNQRNDQILKDMQETQTKLTTLLETQSQQQTMVDKYKQKLTQYDELISKHQEKIDSINEERLQTLRTAQQLHHQWMRVSDETAADTRQQLSQAPDDGELDKIEPVQVKKDANFYAAKADNQKRKLEELRRRQKLDDEDPEEAHQKYINAKLALGEKVKKVQDIEEHVRDLTNDINKRQQLWVEFLTHLKGATATQFDQMLRINNYTGELNFDDVSKTLDLDVHKGERRDARKNDVKGLSGGERSYTTICLLIALGENLETPFRILDEFDVFLDPQNRKLVMSVLIHTAKQLLHRQFIFITPQDLSGIKVDNKVRIFKLAPPERNPRMGGPVQQTLEFSAPSQG